LRILLAISYSPLPVTRGIDRYIVNLVSGLSRYHEVMVVTMALNQSDRKALKRMESENVEVKAIRAPHRKSFLNRIFLKVKNILLSLLTWTPMETLYASPVEYLEECVRTAGDWKADVILANYWHLYRIHGMAPDVEKVLVTLDIDYKVHRGRISAGNKGLRGLLLRMDISMKKRVELKAYRSFEKILTVTESDAEELRKLPGFKDKDIAALPTAIDMGKYGKNEFTRQRDRILFMGSFDSDFNRDALEYFISRIFPAILRRRPDAILELVGTGLEGDGLEAPGSNISVMGRVDDVLPYLGRCSVMVLPLRFAGGLRIRMLEAASMGTPVVSTAAGVKGLGLIEGREYLKASDPDRFAEAVVRILEDEKLGVRIGTNAREWAERNISMKTYPERLSAVLERIV